MSKLKVAVFAVFLSILLLSVAHEGFAQQEAAKDIKARGVTPAALEVNAESAILLEPYTNKILFEKDPHKKLPMASVTKLMTLLLATEAVEEGRFKLTDKVVASENAWEMGGSQIYLEPGEEMTLRDLLLAVGLQSANDASVAVAEYIAGSEEDFVAAMNEKAQRLGLKNTHFVNCHGLTAEDHYTSAYDTAIILKEGLKSPLFRKITAMKEYELRGGAFKLWNTNKLLWWYDGADAGKTGWTEAAKYCLASSAERNGLRLICVVLGAPEPGSHFQESTKLYDYGFNRYRAVNIAPAGEAVGEVEVGKGLKDKVLALTKDPVLLVVPKGEEKGFESSIELPHHIDAPVTKGQQLGWYVVTKGGQEFLRVVLEAEEDIPKAGLLQQAKRVLKVVF